MFQGSDENWYLQMLNDIPRLERSARTTSTREEPFRFREENPIRNPNGVPCVGEARLLSTAQKEASHPIGR